MLALFAPNNNQIQMNSLPDHSQVNDLIREYLQSLDLCKTLESMDT